MPKKLLYMLIALFLFSTVTSAQYQRVVLLEEATNASCGPCAANNPTLQEFFSNNFGGVVSVRYHAWWPGSDPMYSENTSQNADRINYYGINGVPNYLIDGINYGLPSNADAMRQQMMDRLMLGAPIKVNVSSEVTNDSIYADIEIIAGADVNQSNLKLRVAVIERFKEYSSPPGSNGETEFPDVFRFMMPSASGESISAINNSDVLNFSYSTEIATAWNDRDLAVVAWVQSDASKEVINAGIDLPTYILESDDPDASFFTANDSFTKEMKLVNDNASNLNLKIYAAKSTIPSSWSYELLHQENSVDTIEIEVAPGDSITFDLTVNSTDEGPGGSVSIFAENVDDPYNYGFSSNFDAVLKQGNLLFVDADGGESFENVYFQVFDNIEVEYTAINKSTISTLFKEEDPSQFDALFWNISWSFPAVDESAIEFLAGYLDAGGSLFIAGQDIGWDIFDPNGSSGFQAAKDFYNNYLDANYSADNSGIFSMEGVEGDPVGDGLSFSIGAPYNRYPEVISSNSGESVPFLKYSNSNNYGAIHYDNGTYKAVYSGVGLEQITSSDERIKYVGNVLEFFGLITDVEDENENQIVLNYNLAQNYPNPFNPTTKIEYRIKESSKVELKVYDILGSEVAVLVDEYQDAGNYSIDFNAANLSSGVYFYRIKSGDFTSIKKMILLR